MSPSSSKRVKLRQKKRCRRLTRPEECSAIASLRGRKAGIILATEISPAQLSNVIGSVYDCALEPALWPNALQQIAGLLRLDNALLNLSEMPEGRFLLNVAYNIPGEWILKSQEYAPDIVELWGGIGFLMSFDLTEPQVVSRVRNMSEVYHNRYFKDWAEPRNLIDCLMIGVARDQTMLATLGFGRHESEGQITDADLATAHLLTPHIQRAVAISRLFEVKSAIAVNFEATLDALSTAVFLVDENLRVIHANDAARNLPSATSDIAICNGMVKAEPPAFSEALRQAVVLASHQESELGRRGFGIRLGQQSELPAVVHVLPLKHSLLRRSLVPQAVAAIFVAASQAPSPLPHEAFASLYDLTPTETKILSIVGRGKTMDHAATELGVSGNTIKSHLSHIFSKTGTRRQSELVALAMSFLKP
jgi:DNA-binding NarL/FixJ family response regulator